MGIYDKSILTVLAGVGGRGIGVRKLALHVYNLNSSLFLHPDFKEIHGYVQQYLVRNSKSPTAIIERCGRGCYRLNTSHSADARQLAITFAEESEQPKETPTPQPQDMSLSLFD